MKSPITLYYKIWFDDNNKIFNSIENIIVTKIINTIGIAPGTDSYSALNTFRMTNEDGTRNNDIITFLIFRTPEVKLLEMLPLLNETVSIQTKNGFISAQAIYVDYGENPDQALTNLPFVEYAVGANSGEFANAKILTIFFNNLTYTRKVVITF